ncbi:MAG TPA: sel1 repeat family protein [Rhodanobacteraceae bacterium]|nr:sel1 repeat family protein [Rhodanobacteraceae bacterium]
MNRSRLITSVCAALLCVGTTAYATTTATAANPPMTATAAAAKPVKNPNPPPPETDPEIEKIVTAMNNASTWGHPDLFGEYAGMRLYSEGHYAAAIKYFKYGARYADKLSQLSIGLMYDNGQGVAKDPVAACAWLALAAERKFPSFIATRNRVCEALTPAQHDQAVAVLGTLMPEYGDAVAKKRMVRALDMAKTEGTGSRLGFDSGVMTAGVNANCGGPTVGDSPAAGCGSTDFWSPWRWNPKQYFAARDARWRGTVTVGNMKDLNAPASSTSAKPAGDTPTPASSAGH